MDLIRYLKIAGVPEELHADALACFARAKKKSTLPMIASLFAPLVIAFLILTRQLKWESNDVPKWAWWYGNNISINGDGWGMLYPDGTCVNYVDHDVIGRGEAEALHYGDLRYTGDCYYAEGHHPRSAWARFIWLGFRNRAKAISQARGEFVNLNETPIEWGAVPDKATEGCSVMYCTGIWQMRFVEKAFFGKLFLRRNLGFKINNAFVEKKDIAMCVWVQFSLKEWHGN